MTPEFARIVLAELRDLDAKIKAMSEDVCEMKNTMVRIEDNLWLCRIELDAMKGVGAVIDKKLDRIERTLDRIERSAAPPPSRVPRATSPVSLRYTEEESRWPFSSPVAKRAGEVPRASGGMGAAVRTSSLIAATSTQEIQTGTDQ